LQALNNKASGQCPQFVIDACAQSLAQMKELVVAAQDILSGKQVAPSLHATIIDKDAIRMIGMLAQSNVKALQQMIRAVSQCK